MHLPDVRFVIEMLTDLYFKIKHKDLIDIWRHMVNIIPDT